MTHTDLKACPICGRKPVINSRGRAEGVLCAQADHRIQTYGRDGSAFEVWNTRARTPDAAPSQSGDLIAEAEGWTNKPLGGDDTKDFEVVIEMSDRIILKLATALRAAEAENAELTEFRNGYKDTIRRLQDSVSAAEAREQKLREALMALLPKVQGEDGCLEDDDLCTILITFRELVAARRALGGTND